jgi:hypothetical protein
VSSYFLSVDETARRYPPAAECDLDEALSQSRERQAATSPRNDLNRVYMPMGSNFGDVDNDGYPDILDRQPVVLQRWAPCSCTTARDDVRDVTVSSGTGDTQGHGVAFADIDGDGDLVVFR